MEPVSRELSRERLSAIVTHLRKPQAEMHLDGFDFGELLNANSCGTVGCAIGETPAIFPDHFEYITVGTADIQWVRMKGGTYLALEADVAKFLGLSGRHFQALFTPETFLTDYAQDLRLAGVVPLKHTATKEQVADNIQRYIDSFLA